MSRIDIETTADLYFQLNWSSRDVRHTDAFSGYRVNFWRDILPERLNEELMGRQTGDLVHLQLTAQELLGGALPRNVQQIRSHQFNGSRIMDPELKPQTGRFYPKGVIADLPGIFSANRDPFRCVGINNGHITVYMGHPMADKQIDLNVTVGAIHSKLEERGGTSNNWGENITQGVGMQSRWDDQPTDFFSGQPFERKDEAPDTQFYEKPRLVHHIDSTADDMIRQIHGRFVSSQTRILDLMSSWTSHLPHGDRPARVTGLGLNAAELSKNDHLDDYVVHDLNLDPHLPFDANSYDLVLCSLSVEYLISPFDVFTDLARVLRPGGYLVVTFSNRWFETKAIRLWTQLHEFERMGLVLEYFRRGGQFDDLHTYSVRGLPRPADDRYSGQIPFSDPVYAVWGRKR